jgi:hypothetical protein
MPAPESLTPDAADEYPWLYAGDDVVHARKVAAKKVHGIIDDTRGFHSEAGSDSAWASLQLVVTEDAAPPTGTAPVTAPTPA